MNMNELDIMDYLHYIESEVTEIRVKYFAGHYTLTDAIEKQKPLIAKWESINKQLKANNKSFYINSLKNLYLGCSYEYSKMLQTA